MNSAHVHLLFNHFPILGALFSVGLLLVGVILNDRRVNQVGFISMIVFTLLTIPAFLSGEGAEEVLEQYQSVSRAAIHDHEEMAESAFWVMILAGVVALAGLILQWRKEQLHRTMGILTMVIGLFAFGLMVRVGLSGGEIRHPEVVAPIAAPADELYQDDDDD